MVATCSGRYAHPLRLMTSSSCDASLLKDMMAKKAPHKKGSTKAKGVSFAPIPKVTNRHEIVTMEDMPNAWYQPQDYRRIRYGLLSSIQAISNVFNNNMQAEHEQPPLDLSEHCLRGIETGISAELHRRRKLRIKSVTQKVLEQQRFQRAMGVQDPQALAAVSVLCSMGAEESARSVGQLDSRL
jgi:hypothetical protein